jgi:hypothetical protein
MKYMKLRIVLTSWCQSHGSYKLGIANKYEILNNKSSFFIIIRKYYYYIIIVK